MVIFGMAFLILVSFFIRNVILRMFITLIFASLNLLKSKISSFCVCSAKIDFFISPLTIPHQLAMNDCVKEVKIMSTEKRSTNLHKASSILSVVAILLTIALFVRMETVVHDTKMMDTKFTLEIQQIKDALKQERDALQASVKENFDTVGGK